MNYLIHHGVKGMHWGIRKNQLKSEQITNDTVSKYNKKYPTLNRLRISKNTKGEMLTINDEPVGYFNTEKKDNGDVWIQGIEVFEKYKNQKIGTKLLDTAVKKYGANYLSVRKTNNIARYLYSKYGFEIFDETDYMYMMKKGDTNDR